MQPTMRTEQVPITDGLELSIDRWRPAAPATPVKPPAFVLVHGLASNARLWDGVAEHVVEAGHEAIAVDQRGHGRSSKPEGPYDVATVADDLATLIERLGLDRPIVAGQSWGGNVVVELASRHPNLVRGIVCVDGGWLEPSAAFADWEECERVLAPPRLAGVPLAQVEDYIRGAHPDWPEAGIRGTLANFEWRPDGTIAPWLTFDRHIAVLRGLWEHHPSRLFPTVTTPVLLVPVDGGPSDWNERKRGEVEAAEASLPNARVHWFAGDHDIHAQRPAELTAAMLDALADDFFG